MSKRRRGMSLEEKRQVMLEILQESKTPFLLKELEKVGGKRGVVIQSIKDVLQSLVDDNMVDLEKIGIQNFYWSFPSKELVKLKTREETSQAKLAAANLETAALETREAKIGQLAELRTKKRRLLDELAEQKENDPETIAELRTQVSQAKEAANRWVDNYWALKSHCVKKLSVASSEFDRMLQVPSDIDYMQ